jgi:hypothetical protein
MMTPHRWRPRLEVLEDRSLPSSTSVIAPVALGPAAAHAAAPVPITPWGVVSGTWVPGPAPKGGGTLQVLTGSGTVSPVGPVQAALKLQVPGTAQAGRASGTLTLTTTRGTVTLQLQGPLTRGLGGTTLPLNYKITGGTGKYAGATGSGVVVLTETTGGTAPGGHAARAFTLAF